VWRLETQQIDPFLIARDGDYVSMQNTTVTMLIITGFVLFPMLHLHSAKLAAEINARVLYLDGNHLENVERALDGEPFVGTTIA
jgi:hypothetical protein